MRKWNRCLQEELPGPLESLPGGLGAQMPDLTELGAIPVLRSHDIAQSARSCRACVESLMNVPGIIRSDKCQWVSISATNL